jgi:cobalamin biosynthesis protein CobT
MAISKKTAVRAEGRFQKIARMFSRNRHVQVRLQGTSCFTDNEKLINLPANADFLTDDTQHLLEGCLDHETGHCERQQHGLERRAAGDVKFPLYTEEVAKFKTKKERNLLNVFEDIALEINAGRRYIGIYDNLRELNETLTKRLAANASKLSDWKLLTCGIIGRARGFDTTWVPAHVQMILDALTPVIERSKTQTDHVGLSVKRVKETMDIIKSFAEGEEGEEDEHEKGRKGAGAPEDKDDAGGKESKAKPEAGEDKDEVSEDSADDEKASGSEKSEEPEGEESADEEHGAGESEEGEEEGGEEDSKGKGDESKDEGEEESDEKGGSAGEPSEDESAEEESDGSKGESSEADGEESESEAPETSKPGDPKEDAKARDFAKRLEEDDADTEHMTDELNKDIETESKREMSVSKRHYPAPQALALDSHNLIRFDKGDVDAIDRLLEKVRPVISGLRSRLLMYLRGQAQESIDGDKEQGHIDDQALYGIRMGDKRVFYTKSEADEIDTAVGILVDQSGSMGSDNKIIIAKQSAYAVSETFHRLHIPHAVWGFDNRNYAGSSTYEDTDLYNRFTSLDIDIFKRFDEPLPKVRGRFNKMRAQGDNTDGEAVQWAIEQLRARPESRKILIVLSDGHPACSNSDFSVLNQHLKETVMGARKYGVEVFGLGIVSNAVSYFYPDFEVIKAVEELPKAMFKMLRKYLMRPTHRHSA